MRDLSGIKASLLKRVCFLRNLLFAVYAVYGWQTPIRPEERERTRLLCCCWAWGCGRDGERAAGFAHRGPLRRSPTSSLVERENAARKRQLAETQTKTIQSVVFFKHMGNGAGPCGGSGGGDRGCGSSCDPRKGTANRQPPTPKVPRGRV